MPEKKPLRVGISVVTLYFYIWLFRFIGLGRSLKWLLGRLGIDGLQLLSILPLTKAGIRSLEANELLLSMEPHWQANERDKPSSLIYRVVFGWVERATQIQGYMDTIASGVLRIDMDDELVIEPSPKRTAQFSTAKAYLDWLDADPRRRIVIDTMHLQEAVDAGIIHAPLLFISECVNRGRVAAVHLQFRSWRQYWKFLKTPQNTTSWQMLYNAFKQEGLDLGIIELHPKLFYGFLTGGMRTLAAHMRLCHEEAKAKA